jgi:hypothetical protein
MVILQWVVWGFVVFLFGGFLYLLRKDAKDNKPIHIITVLQMILYLLFSILFVFRPWNKLHLIWVIPAAFFLSYSAFLILRIPIVGTILRVGILFFCRIFLVGIGSHIIGVPNGK